jgi:hypothetical protein
MSEIMQTTNVNKKFNGVEECFCPTNLDVALVRPI